MTEETLFEQAIAIESAEERRRFVTEAFDGQPEERERFLDLLAAHEGQDDLFDSPNPLVETEAFPAETADQIGRQIGPFKLLQQIGQGGFGVVYLAEECKAIRRRVALKIIKPGMGSKEVIARFEAERQALAMMEHDNIARVFGGGTTDDGSPYFVMELVKGIPITEYCRQKKLTPEERLELLVSVCRGVHHAHQKGVIHRDLKPSNILVAEYDHRPVVKIIDFGVAKALNQRLTERTLFTQYGSVIGTIQYMSPEQAKFNQLDVDTRSDVYSLGAILYELLTGSTPISKERVQSASFEEVIRWIREEEPSKPSTKVSSAEAKSKEIDHQRLKQSRLIRGDLDWIVMKALEKERDRRYDSAADLADDIERFLHQHPVMASPPSSIYRVRKFVRRHRAAVASVSVLVCLTILLGASLLRWQFERINNGRILAEKRAAELELDNKQREELQRAKLATFEQETIPAIEATIVADDNRNALKLISLASAEFPNDERLAQMMATVSSRWSIQSTPVGAKVTLWGYTDEEAGPVASAMTPATIDVAKGFYRFRLELEGFETVEGIAGPEAVSLSRKLDPLGSIPNGMVRVPASLAAGINDDFFIDRHEVTNKQFQQFVDRGGYENEHLWKGIAGLGAEWRDLVSLYVDQTGKPGPQGWSGGMYPAGTGDHPVVGICWAEAAAYAGWVGRRLPSIHHWNHACGHETQTAMLVKSNLGSEGLLPVGASGAMGPYGTSDTFGNAAEWCFNSYGESARTTGGNSFLGPEYGLRAGTPVAEDTRENFIGFRCIEAPGRVQEELYVGLSDDRGTEYDGREPVDDDTFETLRRSYSYDASLPLEVKLEEVDEGFLNGVTRDTYSMNTAYGGRMLTYVYRPIGTIPSDPQVLVFFPGAGGFKQDSFSYSYGGHIGGIIASNRIVAVPITYGMYERRKEALGESDQQRLITRQIKDVFRCVDFLAGSEIYGDATIGYMGSSYGARVGPIACALHPRLKVAIYLAGGVPRSGTDEVIDTVHFAPRATQPALMLNGIEDHIFPPESSQKPLFRLLGAHPDHKEHLLIGVGHSIDNEQMAEEVDRFLSKHVGKTGFQPKSWREKVGYAWTKTKVLLGSKAGRPKAKELLSEVVSMLKEHGSTENDAKLLADAQYYLAILSSSGDKIAILREAIADAERTLGTDDVATRRMRQFLASSLTQVLFRGILDADSTKSSEFQACKKKLTEVSGLIPEFVWPELGKAIVAFREHDFDKAEAHLKKCESLPFTWNLEFVLRAHLAAGQGRGQEAQDWLSVLELERAKNYEEGGLPKSPDLVAQARGKVQRLEKEQSFSKKADEALNRLLEKYPSHYYLHWLSGLQAIRSEAMEEAHERFGVAFELCPGFRSTDWYAITSQWIGDQAALQRCQKRLVELARLKDGCWVWDGIHIARAYCRIDDDSFFSSKDAGFLQESSRIASPWFTYGAPPMLGRWLKYRLGQNIKMKSYTNNGHPEQQAESMIFDAITEYRFGDRSEAFGKLDEARRFIENRIPNPDGEAFKYIGADHAWAVTRLLLREASTLIELDSDAFDSQVAMAVGRLRNDLSGELGEENTRRILLRVGEALVEKYSSNELASQQ